MKHSIYKTREELPMYLNVIISGGYLLLILSDYYTLNLTKFVSQ